MIECFSALVMANGFTVAKETYNYDQSLYFLLELALGGELYATYNKRNFWGNDAHQQPEKVSQSLFFLVGEALVGPWVRFGGWPGEVR